MTKNEKSEKSLKTCEILTKIKHKKKYFFAAIIIFFLLFWGTYKYANYLKEERQKNIQRLNQVYTKWSKDTRNRELLTELQKILKKIPSMQKKYEGKITQVLLLNLDKEGDERGERLLDSFEAKDDFYFEFAQISLDISKRNYVNALDKSELLKEKIEKASKQHLSLYSYNLLRMSFLAKKIGDRKKEITYLDLLNKLAEDQKENTFAKKMKKHSQLDVIDYISSRMSELEKVLK